MNFKAFFVPTKNSIAILLISLLEVILSLSVSCGPTGRPRTDRQTSRTSREFDFRRRDIHQPVSQPFFTDSQSTSSVVSSQKGQIVFDEPQPSQRSKALLPDLDSSGRPTCLSNPDDTFCETVPNYPNITVKSEIEYSPGEFLEIFGTKDIDGRKSYIDDEITEERVCKRIPKVIYPQMAKNQANQWAYVVNDVEYTQVVVAEICEKEGRPCAYLDRNLPPGMYSRCRQKYSYKRLLALHPTEKRTYSDRFKFPSCCACYVKSNDILGRSLKVSRKPKN